MIRYVFYCRFDTTTSPLSIYQRLRCFEVVTENYQEKQNVSDILKKILESIQAISFGSRKDGSSYASVGRMQEA